MRVFLICLALSGCAAPLKKEKEPLIKYEFRPVNICFVAEKAQSC